MSDPAQAFRVLCVDDDPRTLRAVAASLAPMSLQLDQATNREQALGKVRENTYGLVLMDQVLEGTTGLELIAEIKAVSATPVFALMTGVTDLNLLIGAINGGQASFVVLKPWHGEELREIVRSAMAIHEARVAPQRLEPTASPSPATAAYVAFACAAALLVGNVLVALWNHAHERDDAAQLAANVAAIALRSPPQAVTTMATEGVAYIVITEADGSVAAWALDKTRVQIIGDERDAAVALRDSSHDASVVVRESVDGARRAQVGVDRGALAGSNARVSLSALANIALSLVMLGGLWALRR